MTDARTAGVEFPVSPGIMPVTSLGRLTRIVELTDEPMPAELFELLSAAPDAEAQYEIGIAHATDLARAVLGGGAPGIHLYAFNQHAPVLDVLGRLGAIPD